MQKLLLALAFLFASPAFAQVAGGSSLASGTLTNPTSTLTRPANTTAYASGQLIASSTTAGSVVVPSFALPNSAGGAIIPKLRLQTNVTTGWGSASIQVDTWSPAPTFSNGDGGTYTVATGSTGYLGSFTCSLTQGGDGAYGECVPVSGQVIAPKLASGAHRMMSAAPQMPMPPPST